MSEPREQAAERLASTLASLGLKDEAGNLADEKDREAMAETMLDYDPQLVVRLTEPVATAGALRAPILDLLERVVLWGYLHDFDPDEIDKECDRFLKHLKKHINA